MAIYVNGYLTPIEADSVQDQLSCVVYWRDGERTRVCGDFFVTEPGRPQRLLNR